VIKAIIFMGLGALAFYLYQNPGEMDSVVQQGKDLLNQGATIVQENTN
tara:strand:+ start:4204 stop:4347 length:144 start_codon:yes stop_codon:yes gene_type:complete